MEVEWEVEAFEDVSQKKEEKKAEKQQKEQVLVTEIEKISRVKGGETYIFKAIGFSKKKMHASELAKVRWKIEYDDKGKKGFSDESYTYVDIKKQIVEKKITFISEELLGIQKIKLYAYIKEPLEEVCLNVDFILPSGVFIWTEAKGVGHTFLTIHKNNRVTVYTYGRYDDVYFTQVTGEGVLLKLPDNVAVDYIKDVLYKKMEKPTK